MGLELGLGLAVGKQRRSSLFKAPVLVWDGDDTDASPDFTSITIDPRLPAGSYLYIDYMQGASVIETYKKALTQNEIDAIDPISLTGDDMANGTYNAVAYHKNAAETEIISRIGAAEEVTVAVSSGLTFVGYKLSSVPASAASTYTIGTTSLSGGTGGDVQNGDTVIIAYAETSAGDVAISVNDETGATFTEIPTGELWSDDNNDTNFAVAVAKLSAAPPATFTINGTANANNSQGAILLCWRGGNNTVLDVAATTATGANSAIADGAAITPTTAGSVVVAFYAAAIAAGNAGDYAGSAPSGWENFASLKNTGGATRNLIMCGFTQDWTSGALDPPSRNPGAEVLTSSWAAITIALRPA